MGGCRNYGPPFGSPKYSVPYSTKDPKRDHSVDNRRVYIDLDLYLDLQRRAKIVDPILPMLSILGYWAIILGSFGGPGRSHHLVEEPLAVHCASFLRASRRVVLTFQDEAWARSRL